MLPLHILSYNIYKKPLKMYLLMAGDYFFRLLWSNGWDLFMDKRSIFWSIWRSATEPTFSVPSQPLSVPSQPFSSEPTFVRSWGGWRSVNDVIFPVLPSTPIKCRFCKSFDRNLGYDDDLCMEMDDHCGNCTMADDIDTVKNFAFRFCAYPDY